MFRKALLLSIPILLLFTLFYLFSQGLKRDQTQMPSALLDKPLPDFSISDLYENAFIYNKEVLLGEMALINVWASWCPPCAKEHDIIVQLANQGIKIFGLNYQDDRSAAIHWLKERGDPYKKVLYDERGNVGIDWGVIAVPETFLIDAQGIVRYRHIGGLTIDIWNDQFLPVVNQLKAQQHAE